MEYLDKIVMNIYCLVNFISNSIVDAFLDYHKIYNDLLLNIVTCLENFFFSNIIDIINIIFLKIKKYKFCNHILLVKQV